ncbi:MAG: RNA polymerase sigma factor [Actinomycetota bacterium]
MGTLGDDETDAAAIAASLRAPERFRPIVERHFAEVYAYLGRRTGRDIAEDLAAECFATAFRSRAGFDLHRDSARSWLYGIATNLLRHHRRDEFRRLAAYGRAAAAEPPAEDGAEAVAVRLDASATIGRVAEAFARLDEDQRDALYLVAVVGLSYHDAAQALGVKAGTVHSRVARARTRLRDLAGLMGQQLSDGKER